VGGWVCECVCVFACVCVCVCVRVCGRARVFVCVQELLTKEALKLSEKWDIPKEYCYPVRELCRCERLAKLDVLKFSELWFADLMTNCEPSEVCVALCCSVL